MAYKFIEKESRFPLFFDNRNNTRKTLASLIILEKPLCYGYPCKGIELKYL